MEQNSVDQAIASVSSLEESATRTVSADYAKMQKEIRSWSLWSMTLGAMHILASGVLSAPWGIMLILVGLLSLYFREAAMFVVYGVTLSWAGLSNLLSGDAKWIVGALIQFIFAFQVFLQFIRFRRTEGDYVRINTTPTPLPWVSRAERMFPAGGCVINALALTGTVLVFVALVGLVVINPNASQDVNLNRAMGFLIETIVTIGVLGTALVIAALLSGHKYKILAILGLIAGILNLLVWSALRLL